MTKLAVDNNSNPIQTLALGPNTVTVAAGTTTASAALPVDADFGDVIRLACSTDVYFAFGDSAVVATTSDALFVTGVEVMKVPRNATHIAVLRVANNGIMTITELV